MSVEGRPPTQRPPTQGPQIAQQRAEAERIRQEQIRLEQERRRRDDEERRQRQQGRQRQFGDFGGELVEELPSGDWVFVKGGGKVPTEAEQKAESEKAYDKFLQDTFRESYSQLSPEERLGFQQGVEYTPATGEAKVTDFTRRFVQPESVTNQQIVNDLRQNVEESTLGYGRFEGYAISRDREGRVTDVSSSVFLPTFIPNMKARPAQIDANVRVGYADFTKTSVKGERVPLRYEIGLGGKDSTFNVFERDSGKRVPLKYEVNLEDRLSGGPYHYFRDIGKPEKQVFEGTTPFMDLPEKDDPLAGFVNVFKNIPEFGKAAGAYVTGSRYDPKYEPEVEASIFSGLFGVGKRFVERKPVELQLTLAAKEFGEIGQFIQKRPFYAAGSIAASAALWLFPYGKAASAARASIPGLKAATKAPRARFDYDPLRGSFADRPSVRFGPYNPTRWENPEALAELAKYRAVVDLPKSVKVAVPTSATRFTAFESARTRQESATVVETRGGSLILRQEPIARTKVESIGVESAKQTVQKVMNQTTQSGGAGKGTRPSISYERSIAGVSLGFGGATGAGRRRRVVPTEYESYVLAYPQTTKNFLGSTLKNLGISRTDTGMRNVLQNLTGTRSRGATSSRSILSEITGLRGTEMQGFKLGQLSLTRTAQVQTPKVASDLQSLLRTTGISVPRSRVPTLRIPKALLLPGFTQPRKRKGKAGRKTRVGLRTYAASDYVAAIAGKELGKQFKKIAGSY